MHPRRAGSSVDGDIAGTMTIEIIVHRRSIAGRRGSRPVERGKARWTLGSRPRRAPAVPRATGPGGHAYVPTLGVSPYPTRPEPSTQSLHHESTGSRPIRDPIGSRVTSPPSAEVGNPIIPLRPPPSDPPPLPDPFQSGVRQYPPTPPLFAHRIPRIEVDTSPFLDFPQQARSCSRHAHAIGCTCTLDVESERHGGSACEVDFHVGCAQICSWMPPSQPQQYSLLTYFLHSSSPNER